jgi:hypothetical protein
MEPRNRFQGMNSACLCSLAGRYDNPITTRFLAPLDCLKIPAQEKFEAEKDGGHKGRNDYVRDTWSRERIGNVGKERGKVHCKNRLAIPGPRRDYSPPGGVWLVTSWLGMGKSLNIFTV